MDEHDPDVPLHEKSVRLRGAFVSGKLDMQGCACNKALTLARCRIEGTPSFLNARMRGLVLSGCRCPGITADNAVFDGSVFLRAGFICTGEISLPGARISGDLQICDADLASDGTDALFAPSLRVGGSVYGYRPVRVLVWAVALMVSVGLFFELAWRAGDMAPNAAAVLVSADWIAATKSHPQNPAAFWSSPGQAGQDYETFNSFAYAADLLVPIVNLGQEAAWSPSTSRSLWGQNGWWLRWVAKLVGWVITALGAAAVTGVIRRE